MIQYIMNFELVEEAKKAKKALIFKQYLMPKISWENILNHIYKESIVDNINLRKKTEITNDRESMDYIGNIQIQNKFWLAPQEPNLFKEFPQISELLDDLNSLKNNISCEYYNKRTHDCESDWHPQGIRISLSNRIVTDHHDPHDIFYWQIVGTSFWKIDMDITYILEPGDLLYLPKENSHEVWCDGPRAGLLIDNLN